jgi:elongation factor 1-gamma
VAKANGLDIELVDSFAGNLHPDHTKASPLGKIPAFIGEDGFALHEILAIAIYCEFSVVMLGYLMLLSICPVPPFVMSKIYS